MKKPKLLILTPIYFGDGTGASIYYKTLVSSLLSDLNIDISIVSDCEPGVSKEHYYKLFPVRAGRDRNLPRDLIAYVVQNILYLKLPKIIQIENPTTVLIHTYFFNKPGLLSYLMRIIRQKYPQCRLIADVRDRLLPMKRAAVLTYFDKIIACSQNVRHHLETIGCDKKRIVDIPVIHQPLEAKSQEVDATLRRFGLKNKNYIFYAGIINKAKGVEAIIDAFLEYVLPRHPNYLLVLSGAIKTSVAEILEKLKRPNICYLGKSNYADVINLMSKAAVCVNVSPNEGMPRSSLESIDLKKPTILPSNVPEFAKYCAEWIAHDLDPASIGKLLIRGLETKTSPPYPVEKHYPEKVIARYKDVLNLL